MAGTGVFSGWRVALPSVSDLDGAARLMRQEGAELARFALGASDTSARPLESWIVDLYSGDFDDVMFFTAQSVRLVVEFARQLEREEEVASALCSVRKLVQGPKTAS